MRLFAPGNAKVADNSLRSIHSMLLTQGFGRTLEYFCTFPVFSIA